MTPQADTPSTTDDLPPRTSRDTAQDPVYPLTLSAWRTLVDDRERAGLPNLRLMDPAPSLSEDGVQVTVMAKGIDHLDFYLEDKPVLQRQAATPDQPQTFIIPFPGVLDANNPPQRLRVDGLSTAGVVAAVTRVRFPVRKAHKD